MCPDEPGRLAAASSVAVDDITVAIAFPHENSGLAVAIIAIRLPSVETKRLVPIRLAAGGHSTSGPADTQDVRVGSRTVVWATYLPFFNQYDNEYLYAHGEVLFLIVGAPPTARGDAPPDVALAIKALP